ncbi:MAG: type II toxin-antitoxin system RelE/ParE family toxin [Bacteroidota bacterium]
MAEIVWTEPALQDLDRIADYIALDNHTAARQLVQNSFDTVDQLVDNPRLGKAVEELEDSVYRELVVPPCRIFYRLDDQNIFIIHIMRSEQMLHVSLLKSR